MPDNILILGNIMSIIDISNGKLYIDTDKKSVLILGYSVHLTGSEFSILCAVAQNHGISKEGLMDGCFEGKALTAGNVAVHVYNINRKAKEITGRRFISGNRKYGYRIVEYI